MNFEQKLLEGTLVGRSKRFTADVELDDGKHVSVHCANAGSLKTCSEPGSRVLVLPIENPRLKFNHQLEIVYSGKVPVAVHAGRPITVLAEGIMAGEVQEIAGYATLKRDPIRNRGARIDMIAEGNSLRTCYVRAETVTLAEDGIALYPDTQIQDFQATMQVFTNLVREGNRVVIALAVQRADAEAVRLANEIDLEFCEVFRDGVARGVEVIAYRTHVSRKGLKLEHALPVDLSPPPKTKK